MELSAFLEAIPWLVDPANWRGRGSIPIRLVEHVQISTIPLVAAMLVAIPAGVLAGHHRRGQAVGAFIANLGRAIPTLALLVFGFILATSVLDLGIGFWPIVFALFLLALHPLFTNSYTAVREVEPALVEAARGMGYDESRVLLDVELPVASPVILTAVRITAVQVVATAPLAPLTAGGGLGRFILDGFQRRDFAGMFGGVILVALLALAVDWLLSRAERRLVPRGIRRSDASAAEVAATTGRAA